MVFTNAFSGVPILFDKWAPTGVGGFVGSIFAIAFSAFILRMLIFARSYLNYEYWNAVNPVSKSFIIEETGRVATI
jgi:hypothetical protein